MRQSGGVLLVARAGRTVADTETQPCGRHCRMAGSQCGTRCSRSLRAAFLAGSLLPVDCGSGRLAWTLRQHRYRRSLPACSIGICSHLSSEGASAATTQVCRAWLASACGNSAGSCFRACSRTSARAERSRTVLPQRHSQGPGSPTLINHCAPSHRVAASASTHCPRKREGI